MGFTRSSLLKTTSICSQLAMEKSVLSWFGITLGRNFSLLLTHWTESTTPEFRSMPFQKREYLNLQLWGETRSTSGPSPKNRNWSTMMCSCRRVVRTNLRRLLLSITFATHNRLPGRTRACHSSSNRSHNRKTSKVQL